MHKYRSMVIIDNLNGLQLSSIVTNNFCIKAFALTFWFNGIIGDTMAVETSMTHIDDAH